jgi:adenine nucleotide transporter 17
MSNAVANGLAGAGGGIIAQIITYPLQTVHNPLPQLSHIMQYSLFLSNSSGGYTVCR